MRIKLMNCYIDNLTLYETVEKIEGFIKSGEQHQHVVVNVDKICKANKNKQLLNIINNCDLINADGMPVVWASRLLGVPLKQRVAGIDLFEMLVEKSAEKGWKPFFLGAKEEVVRKLVEIYKNKYPNLKIAGYKNGYWEKNEEQEIGEYIKSCKPDILFVAISSPKKEQFLSKYLEYLNIPFSMGVGGSFDVVIGKTKRAPVWMQKYGLEWFYRFLQEPHRMFKRYFVDDSYFIYLFIKELYQKIKKRRA
jgi:N-acetylglucosaminyldiphosphoundecaprenol N-acetyl-beta-D-mannosaminyltransferase